MVKFLQISGVLTTVLALALLTGCGPKATVGGYRQILDHYHGEHIDKLVADWGPPRSKHVYADGRHEYLFNKEYRQDYLESPLYPSIDLGYRYSRSYWGIGGVFSPRMVSSRISSCETRVITDKRDKIVEYYFRGEACRAIPYKRASEN